MKAVRIHQFGSPEVMRLEEIDVPEPGADEVLVQLETAGVGPWDGWGRAGRSVLPQPLPLTLGADLAGRVLTLGRGVRGLERGQEVFGVTNKRFTGSYAEYALASASMIARRPTEVDLASAAGAPVVAVAALPYASVRPCRSPTQGARTRCWRARYLVHRASSFSQSNEHAGPLEPRC